MSIKKGFTLIELLVVAVIVGILVAIAIPIYFTSLQQGAANSAEHNLISIYTAQQNYAFTNSGNYCLAGCADQLQTNCALSMDSIDCNLSLNITDNYYTYACAGTTCTATSNSKPITTLTVTLANPIVLPGSSSTLNPICSPSTSTFCPTN